MGSNQKRSSYKLTKTTQELSGSMKLLKDGVGLFRNSYYQSFSKSINDFLDISRQQEYQQDKHKLFELQLALFQALVPGENAVTTAKKALEINPEEGIRMQRTRNKYLNVAYRQIADGIAWRELRFDRFNARVLAQGQSAGHIDNKLGRARELNFAQDVADQLGQSVLVNDITNCLLIGDIICIDENGMPFIFEIKTKQIKYIKTILDRIEKGYILDKKQEPRLLVAQNMLFSRSYRSGKDHIPVLDISHKASDHLLEVHKILREASLNGIAGALVAPYLYVEAFDMSVDNFQEPKRDEDLFQGTPIGTLSNYDRLAMLHDKQVPRSHVPYTNFPFDTDLVTKLIMGTIYLNAYVIKEPLISEFAKYGWILSVNIDGFDNANNFPNNLRTDYFSSAALFPESPYKEPDVYVLRHSYDGFTIPIFGYIMTMLTEFVSVEYIATMLHELHVNAHNGGPSPVYPISLSDRSRWI